MRVVTALALRLALAHGFGGQIPECGGQGDGLGQQNRLMPLDKAGIQLGPGKGRVGEDALQEQQVGLEATHGGFLNHGQQTLAGFLAVLAPGNQFAEHRVVEG